jgi:hypothetical protein
VTIRVLEDEIGLIFRQKTKFLKKVFHAYSILWNISLYINEVIIRVLDDEIGLFFRQKTKFLNKVFHVSSILWNILFISVKKCFFIK